MVNNLGILNTMLFAFCVLPTTVMQSCNNLKTHYAAASVVDKKTVDTVSNTVKGIAKPFIHYYPFNSELDTEQNIHDGWIDTFRNDNRWFRASCDSGEALTIEYYKEGTWHINFRGDIFNLRHFGLGDVNKDGYNDLVVDHKYGSTINFFNPAINIFDSVAWFMLPFEGVLDGKRLIYYNSFGDNMTPMTSELYTFKNKRPYYYYVLRLVDANHDSTNLADSFIGLWKYKNGDGDIDSATLIKKIKYNEDTEQEAYDYAKFWAKNYRRLIKQYDH